MEEYYQEMEMTLVRTNIEEDTKAVHDDFTNKISFQHHDHKIILKPLSPREVCDDQIRMRNPTKNVVNPTKMSHMNQAC